MLFKARLPAKQGNIFKLNAHDLLEQKCTCIFFVQVLQIKGFFVFHILWQISPTLHTPCTVLYIVERPVPELYNSSLINGLQSEPISLLFFSHHKTKRNNPFLEHACNIKATTKWCSHSVAGELRCTWSWIFDKRALHHSQDRARTVALPANGCRQVSLSKRRERTHVGKRQARENSRGRVT